MATSILGDQDSTERPAATRGRISTHYPASFEETIIVADSFDPYREALVREEMTSWSEDFDDLEPGEKNRIEVALHADPENCSQLEYIRIHTGFCRTVIVTADDISRVSQ